MKNLLFTFLIILLGISFNNASAQTATITFSEESFNVAKQYGGTELQQTGQYTFTSVPVPPEPCIGMPLSADKAQEYQDAANSCCCITGICMWDGCKYIMYTFYPETMVNCLQPEWHEPINLPMTANSEP